MGFAINTNNDALNTYRNLTNVQNSLSSSLAKLSSGLRINQAGDDAAGLTISTQLGSQVSGLQQASRNAQDGVSVVQTADGALSQAQSLLGRLRDLAVQGANDSNSDTARTAIQTEATSITDELTRLGNSVNFNGKNLLDGSSSTLNFQVGADGNSQSQIQVNLSQANLVNVASTLRSGGAGTEVTAAQTTGSMEFTSTNGSTATTVSVAALGTFTTAADAAKALNADSGFASKFTASVDSATSKVFIAAKDGGTTTTQSATTSGGTTTYTSIGSAQTGVGAISFNNAANAQAAITAIDTQITAVSSARANIGALENRFSSAVSTIGTSVTNLTAAKSRITDVDMASEMVNYSRANILSQSGTAMLAQANSMPQLALKLLG